MKTKLSYLLIALNATISFAHAEEVDTKTHVNTAKEHAKEGNYDEALNKLNEAILANPKDPRAYRLRANVYFAQGNFPKALADFDQVVKLNPTDASAYTDRAVTHNSMLNYGAALVDINKALSIDPNDEYAKKVKEHIEADMKGDQNKDAKPKKKVVYHKKLG